MAAYGIKFHRKRWLAHADWPASDDAHAAFQKGWRPYVWVNSIQAAEKFGSIAAANEFLSKLPCRQHAEVCLIPATHGPKGTTGGSAVVLKFARAA